MRLKENLDRGDGDRIRFRYGRPVGLVRYRRIIHLVGSQTREEPGRRGHDDLIRKIVLLLSSSDAEFTTVAEIVGTTDRKVSVQNVTSEY